jgi:hypothetical protein
MVYEGARADRVILDEMSGWHERTPATFTFGWADGTTSTTTGISSVETRGGIDPDKAKAAVEEFAAKMRETLEPDVYAMMDREGYFDILAPTVMEPGRLHRAGAPDPVVRTITWPSGKFVIPMDEGLTMFEEDGTITFGLDPAKPADSDEFADTIAPLESLE